MVNFIVEKLPDEPIIVIREQESYNPIEELGNLIEAIVAGLDSFERPGYAIIIQKSGYSIDEMIIGAKDMRVKGERVRSHPNHRGTLFVTPAEFNKMALEGLADEALGRLIYSMFDTLDEALTFARSNL